MYYKKSLGKFGENIAINYYQKRGYKLITKNYHSRYGEIDIILEKQNKIIVVEVKTRKKKLFLWAEESINYKKIDNIYKTYQVLAKDKKLPPFFYLEAIIIEINGPKAKIRRYKI